MNVEIAAGLLVVVGAAHSLVGERVIVRPAIADTRWTRSIGPVASAKVVRFAWHLTTLAWWALAAVVWGLDPAAAIGLVGLTAAVAIIAMLPGHLAWPAFAAIALLGLAEAFGARWDPAVGWVIGGAGAVGMLALGVRSAISGRVTTWNDGR